MLAASNFSFQFNLKSSQIGFCFTENFVVKVPDALTLLNPRVSLHASRNAAALDAGVHPPSRSLQDLALLISSLPLPILDPVISPAFHSSRAQSSALSALLCSVSIDSPGLLVISSSLTVLNDIGFVS